MKFSPKKDTDLGGFELHPPGTYDFTIIQASEEVSKSGNEMIKLKLALYTPTGKQFRIYDYLLESVAYKLKHFCSSVKLLNEYESGCIYADMLPTRSGKCIIEVQSDKAGKYGDKNVVKDYCVSESTQTDNCADVNTQDIPF